MSEKDRRPLGERDENERTQPFGSQPARHRRSIPDDDKDVTPYEPYAAGPDIPLPRREREGGIDPALPYRSDSPRRNIPHYGDDEASVYNAYEQAGYLTDRATDDDDDLIFEEPEKPVVSEDFLNFTFTPDPPAERVKTIPEMPRFTFSADTVAAAPAAGGIDFPLLLKSLVVILLISMGAATIFTWWTPNSFLSSSSSLPLVIAQATLNSMGVNPPGPIATSAVDAAAYEARSIGIVSGHRGLHPETGLPDPGAMCNDGLTEQEINESIATQVATRLTELGYYVEIFDEFDPDLTGYRARAMVSIHADSCDYINDIATGFKVASFEVSTTPEKDQLLTSCLIDRYGSITGLNQHASITYDMTHYHNFAELGSETPGAIIEVGFMYLDREFLTGQSNVAAEGIVQGILCFLNNETVE